MSLRNWIYAAACAVGIARAVRLVRSSCGAARHLMQCPRYRVNLQSVVHVGSRMYAVGPKYTMPVSGSHYITPALLCIECLCAMKRSIKIYDKLDACEYKIEVNVVGDNEDDLGDLSEAGLSSWELKRVQMHELALQKFVKGHRVGFTYNCKVDALDMVNYSNSVDAVKEMYRRARKRSKGRK